MATLVAVKYRNEDVAQEALSVLSDLQRQELIHIGDAIVITHDGDKVRLDQSINLTRRGALGGALWGGLIGLIFLVPVTGLAVGAGVGALSGRLSDYGINDQFAKELGENVMPGEAALLVLARSSAPDRVSSELRKHNFGGELMYTNLSEEAEQALRDNAASE